MKDKNTPAFPRPSSPAHEYGFHKHQDGMTLRDYFAGKALTSPVCLELSSTNNWDNEVRSRWAYAQADEMLKAREE